MSLVYVVLANELQIGGVHAFSLVIKFTNKSNVLQAPHELLNNISG
jgi:hypothetical protein